MARRGLTSARGSKSPAHGLQRAAFVGVLPAPDHSSRVPSIMFEVLLTIHIIACVAMTVTILLQRSEGGGLGLGTGGGVGGLMTGRGAANALTRTTVIFATIFISTSITLALMAKANRGTNSILPTSGGGLTLPTAPLPAVPTGPLPATPAPVTPVGEPSAIPVPAAPAPATPAPGTPAGTQPTPQPASPPPPAGGN